MTTAHHSQPHEQPAPDPCARPPLNLLSVLWLQAVALFEQLKTFSGDFSRRIPALEALVRAYVCGAANDRLVADHRLRARLTREAETREQARETARNALNPGAVRIPHPGWFTIAGHRSKAIAARAGQGAHPLRQGVFNPFPPPVALQPFNRDAPHFRPHHVRPRIDALTEPAASPDRIVTAPPPVTQSLPPRRGAAARLAVIAGVLADPEPAIRRAMRIIAARWEDSTLRLPGPMPRELDALAVLEGPTPQDDHPRPAHPAVFGPDFFIVEPPKRLPPRIFSLSG